MKGKEGKLRGRREIEGCPSLSGERKKALKGSEKTKTTGRGDTEDDC